MTAAMTDPNQRSIGARLMARRAQLGVSLDQVAARTRIRRVYLEALEEERFDIFPGDAYLKGYLKGYAESLELDPQPLLAELARHRSFQAPLSTMDAGPEPASAGAAAVPRTARRRGGLLVAAGLALALVGAGLWFGRQDAGKPVAEIAAPPAPAPAPAPQPPPALGGGNQTGSETLAEPVKVAAGPVAGVAAPASGTETIPVPGSALSAPTQGTEAPATNPAVAPAIGVLRLQAHGPGQLEITVDGRPAQRYRLQANTILSWKIGRSARIYVDTPGNVRLWLAGRPVDLAGRNQIVLEPGEESAR